MIFAGFALAHSLIVFELNPLCRAPNAQCTGRVEVQIAFLVPLICTTGRWNPTPSSSNQGNRKGDLLHLLIVFELNPLCRAPNAQCTGRLEERDL